jgi:hypothetical protein
MGKKVKKFDCVKMKHEIQQKILKEMEELSPEEFREKSRQRILADPILGPIWRKIEQAGDPARRGGARPSPSSS